MDAPHQAGAAGHDSDPARTPASERLQLEVALLAAEATVRADETDRAANGGWVIVLAVSDMDIRDYIKQCLRAQPDLRIVETRTEDDPFDVARRIQARLLISDLPFGPDDTTRARGMPVVLIGDELPERLPTGDAIRIAFLLQPFNARRLLETVEHLLAGSGSSSGDVPRR
jgi:hypothetical protein